MDNYTAGELAFRNGFAAALDLEKMRKRVCIGLQRTVFWCSRVTQEYCGSSGNCAACRAIAETIIEEANAGR